MQALCQFRKACSPRQARRPTAHLRAPRSPVRTKPVPDASYRRAKQERAAIRAFASLLKEIVTMLM